MRMLSVVPLVLLLGAGSCNENACTKVTQTVVGPNVGAGDSGASPAAPGACEAAARVNASVLGGGTVRVGSEERLDATAFTASGQEIKPPCSDSKVVTWSAFAGPCEFTTSPTGFSPEFRGNSPGSCSTSVSIDGKGASVSIRVVE